MLHKQSAKHMASVEDYRQRLANLQGAWDTLSLLSHLGGDGSDLSSTRQAFEALASELVDSLSGETCRKSLLALQAKTQIAIDILVRNLFERTADVGFLSADDDLCAYLREVDTARRAGGQDLTARSEQMLSRLREYVAKYSVYKDIVVLSPDGEVLLSLQGQTVAERSSDPLIRATIDTRAAYVETYRFVDFQPQQQRSLIYSYRIVDAGTTRGVLCLSFDLQDEVRRIFTKLADTNDWAVFTFLDATGTVIASSDPWQVPAGAPLPLALNAEGGIVRFAGREYLAVTRRTHGYQGYMGPGWFAHAMVPLEHAFSAGAGTTHLDQSVIEELCESATIFSPELRRIPAHARQIQRELNRSVWNGHVRLDRRSESDTGFAKALLWEIGNAGRRTQDTFEKSIIDLQSTVTSAILESTELLASLAVDILDRNYYERANDCRWWALNATLIEHLERNAGDVDRVTEVLRHINSLYTVYHSIVLFDTQRRIVAVSNLKQGALVGTTCNESWASETLQLRDSQAFCVSPFARSALYDNEYTFVFGAALRTAQGRTVGGIGIVFDSTPQLRAMLKYSLPRNEGGAASVGVFIDADRRVLSATDLYNPGDTIDLPREQLQAHKGAGARVIERGGMHYAVATCLTPGYREYDRVRVTAIVMTPLGLRQTRQRSTFKTPTANTKRTHVDDQVLEVATFVCGEQWLGILREEIVESIASTGIRSLPGKPSWHAGLLMHQGNPLPVIDLAQLTGHPSQATVRDVIVIQPADRSQRIGLLVDELASIPEIPASRILPLNDYASRSMTRLIDRAVRPYQPEDPVLLILNIEQLLAHVRCEVGALVQG
ncbi:MAG: chemotaxis protein CheW [Steroidobacteraceae bacterium]